MKKWRKYPFFLLMVISCICYWEYRILTNIRYREKQQEILVTTEARQNDAVRAAVKQKVSAKAKGKKGRESQKAAEAKKNAEQENTEKDKKTENLEKMRKRNFQRVEMDYLSDALFIGDSRTATLYEYAGWSHTDFFVKYGQTVWDVWDNTMDGRSLEDMLRGKAYGKIYIMLGINELGTGTPDSFAAQFQAVVDRVRELQPKAVVFVESIMHVTAGKDAQGTYINNAEIDARNDKLKRLEDKQNIFYIDANEVMDEPGTGKLREEYSFDGVHLQVKYIEVWREFLLDHGII